MSEPTKKVFGTAVGGYNRSEVDQYVAWLQKTLSDLESYNSLAVREQQNLRERLVEVEEQLKAAICVRNRPQPDCPLGQLVSHLHSFALAMT